MTEKYSEDLGITPVEKAKLTTIETYTGNYFDYADFDSDDIHIEDVAHALSLKCRFGGHCQRFYSVGQHAILVYSLMSHQGESATDCFFGLCHDNHESVIEDLTRPFKIYLGDTSFLAKFREIEEQYDSAFFSKYGFAPYEYKKHLIKFYDNWALKIEQNYIMKKTSKRWNIEGDFPEEPNWVSENFFKEPIANAEIEALYLLSFDQALGRVQQTLNIQN